MMQPTKGQDRALVKGKLALSLKWFTTIMPKAKPVAVTIGAVSQRTASNSPPAGDVSRNTDNQIE